MYMPKQSREVNTAVFSEDDLSRASHRAHGVWSPRERSDEEASEMISFVDAIGEWRYKIYGIY